MHTIRNLATFSALKEKLKEIKDLSFRGSGCQANFMSRDG